MASKSKSKSAPPRKRTNDLSQLGLMGLGSFDDDDEADDDVDDDSLEAELQAIMSGKEPQRKSKPKKAVNIMSIEDMANECMKDLVSEDEDDSNLSADEDLLSELHEIIPDHEDKPSTPIKRESSVPQEPPTKIRPIQSDSGAQALVTSLEDRWENYSEAEKCAKSIGDVSKARRYGRAVKTLETLIKEVKSGKAINEENIPPPVAIPKPKTIDEMPATILIPEKVSPPPGNDTSPPPAASDTPPRQASLQSQASIDSGISRRTPSQKRMDNTCTLLCSRRDQYKLAALNAKKNGDMQTAVKYVKISKQFDAVIEAQAKGQPIDLSKMPPPPPGFAKESVPTIIPIREAPAVPPHAPLITNNVLETSEKPSGEAETPIPDEAEDPNLFGAPPPPKTILEALTQRLEKYKSTQTAATAENNASKAKRLGRIVKQYEDAIKSHKAGKPVDFESLPAPPGFGAIPGVGAQQATPQPATPAAKPKATPAQTPRPTPSSAPAALTPNQNEQNKTATAGSSPNTLLTKQLNFLVERKKLFREAALEAKQRGDIVQAKEYLRLAKGFDPMIEATQCGLPIDASTIPTPPQLSEDFVIVDQSQCLPEDWGGDKEELFRNLERDLIKQYEICQRNMNHFLKLGDVSSSTKFEKLGQETKKDLYVVKHLWEKGETLPKFHYETRVFSMVQCNSHLSDNEVEVTILRGINLPGKPSELDSYVRIEFPYPQDGVQKAKTQTIKDTNSPEYKATFKFEINRKSRTLARVFKRHGMKMEVWSKGGFLRSDSLLGTAVMKLDALEKKCVIHDSFDLMDGRKACGGKMEAKLCIRDPLLAKQVEEVREKWLVIGS